MGEKKPSKVSLQRIEGSEEQVQKLFLSNEVTVNLDANSILMNFKAKIPIGNKVIVEHNPVYLDIYHAKRFSQMLNKSIVAFEEKFGEIKEPEFMQNFRKETSKAKDKLRKSIPEENKNYLG